MEPAIWYQTLIKPYWAPPSSVFGPIWSVLYIVILISYGTVFYQTIIKRLAWLVALPFALNIIFNLSFTTIQFDLKNNILAAIDILLILGTLIWALVVIYPCKKWIAIINIPHLLWVIFATILQLSITYLNK